MYMKNENRSNTNTNYSFQSLYFLKLRILFFLYLNPMIENYDTNIFEGTIELWLHDKKIKIKLMIFY